MDDNELLELAAKAVNMKIVDIKPEGLLVKKGSHPISFLWNPLTDDGDALRLAVKLNLSIHQHQHGAGWVDVGPIKILTGGDPYAATRRAIVRAAAEIGKGMK
jgi:hypothetical protein